MSSTHINYDSVAEVYDLYVTADYDVPFLLPETADVAGRVVELTAGTGQLMPGKDPGGLVVGVPRIL